MNKNRKTIKMPVRYLMNAVLVALLFVALSYLTRNILSTYQNKVLMTVGINIILAVSLNVATGYLGQLPLGHAGFMAVGAYTCALFTKFCPLPDGVSFAIGLVLACIVAGLFGVLIGIPALRLTGDYLAILTLGFGEIIRITLNNIDDVLGFKLFYGSKGLKNIPKYSNFTNVFLCVVITCFLIHAMMKSRHGRAVLAIRDNEIAAESCGIQTTYYKVMAFAFSAAFAGLAGGLYACYIGVLNPSTFGFMKSIEILVMVVLGGMGSMLGSILSATVLTILPEATRSFESYRMVVYSLVLILMMIFRPGGLLMSLEKYRTLFKPYHTKINEYVHKHSSMKTFLHSCGSIFPVIGDLAEAGFDILNPVQTSAANMDPARLKQEYGKDITFWGGGCNTRKILNMGTEKEVYDYCRRMIDIFFQDGGFVFNQEHNILGDVPPQNIMAMYKAVEDARR